MLQETPGFIILSLYIEQLHPYKAKTEQNKKKHRAVIKARPLHREKDANKL